MILKIYHIAIILTLFLCQFSQSAVAQTFFNEKWSGHDALPQGWTTIGCSKTPDGGCAEWFKAGEGWKNLTGEYGKSCLGSYSTTFEGGKVDTWLISPAISVPQTGGFIVLPMWTVNRENTNACKMSVYISDKGPQKSDFASDAVLTKRIQANAAAADVTIPLSDFAGKEIHIAVVNEGTQAGTLCLGDIVGAVYTASIRNLTPLLVKPGEPVTVTCLVDMQALCSGMQLKLETSEGYSEVLGADNLPLPEGIRNIPASFPPFSPKGDIVEYTLTLTPSINGAEPTVLHGNVAAGEGYPAICLMEEGTGEKCGYCPGGVAVIDRFSELWPERFIPVAIHCFENFSTGVMENSEYADPFVTIPGLAITSLPSAILNRAELTNPTDFTGIMTSVESIMASRSAMKVAIDRVDCDFATGHVDVKFTASACAPFPSVGVNAAAILTADGLTGTTRQWYQSNYYSKTSKERFVGDDPLMEEWWPYMKFWCEYPSKDVSPTDYQYDHVGMGIYPGFNGDDTLLDSDWSAAQSQSGSISFDMPMQRQANAFGVQDSHKTAVTVVLIRESDGSILAADRVEADRFNQELSGIEDVAAPADDIRAAYSGGVLTIRTPRDMTVDIFSSTGIRIARINATEGVNSVPLDYNGVVIIKGDTFAKRFMTTK